MTMKEDGDNSGGMNCQNCPRKVNRVFCCFVCKGHLDVVALLVNHGASDV